MFTEPDIWSGGSFELALELGSKNDVRLRTSLDALWSHPSITGCYLDRNREPITQSRIEVQSCGLDVCLYGLAITPNGKEVACCSYPIRYEDGRDWLYLSIPMGSMATAYQVGAYPFSDGGSLDWILPVSDWLRSIGESVFCAAEFELGLVGWEVDSQDDTSDSIRCKGVPESRWVGYIVRDESVLHWYPPTILISPMEFDK